MAEKDDPSLILKSFTDATTVVETKAAHQLLRRQMLFGKGLLHEVEKELWLFPTDSESEH